MWRRSGRLRPKSYLVCASKCLQIFNDLAKHASVAIVHDVILPIASVPEVAFEQHQARLKELQDLGMCIGNWGRREKFVRHLHRSSLERWL